MPGFTRLESPGSRQSPLQGTPAKAACPAWVEEYRRPQIRLRSAFSPLSSTVPEYLCGSEKEFAIYRAQQFHRNKPARIPTFPPEPKDELDIDQVSFAPGITG